MDPARKYGSHRCIGAVERGVCGWIAHGEMQSKGGEADNMVAPEVGIAHVAHTFNCPPRSFSLFYDNFFERQSVTDGTYHILDLLHVQQGAPTPQPYFSSLPVCAVDRSSSSPGGIRREPVLGQ